MKIALLLLIATFVLGVGSCNLQKGYEFAQQSQTSPTTTATATATPDEDATPTSSTTVTSTPTATTTPTITATSTATTTATATATASSAALRAAVSSLSVNELFKKIVIPLNKGSSSSATGPSENWLGAQNQNSQELIPGASLDTDRDGFTDALEQRLGSDPSDPRSLPPAEVFTSSLAERFIGIDGDYDGIANRAELQANLNPNNVDTDADGISDSAEVLSGSDPLNDKSVPNNDIDRDGLSDQYENANGLNPSAADTDQDGLRDDLELSLGADPFNNDTDGDGILDGREYLSKSDPLKRE